MLVLGLLGLLKIRVTDIISMVTKLGILQPSSHLVVPYNTNLFLGNTGQMNHLN